MFVQIIEGKVSDRSGLRRQFDRWESELRPGAAGFLGSTGGVTNDGVGFAIARFESAAAANANSERAEQGAVRAVGRQVGLPVNPVLGLDDGRVANPPPAGLGHDRCYSEMPQGMPLL